MVLSFYRKFLGKTNVPIVPSPMYRKRVRTFRLILLFLSCDADSVCFLGYCLIHTQQTPSGLYFLCDFYTLNKLKDEFCINKI